MQKLCFTCGDINGIGPEITIKTFNEIYNPAKRKIVYFCPSNVFENAASLVNPNFEFRIVKSFDGKTVSDKITVVDIGKIKQNISKPDAKSGRISFESIKKSFELVNSKFADAVITAPVSKTSLHLAGINFPGQTEMFAGFCGSKNYMMVFLSRKMICGLLTIHEPIKNVPGLITISSINKSLRILSKVLSDDLKIENPEIAVLGLNPHAGEMGNIGKEEIRIITPAINSSNVKNVFGPFVPDAFFAARQFKKYDAVLGMYHDQLLIPFKFMNFNSGVNYTAGLPIIRTSPDHGTAFDIAGIGIADSKSMTEAVYWAEKISRNRKKKNAV